MDENILNMDRLSLQNIDSMIETFAQFFADEFENSFDMDNYENYESNLNNSNKSLL